jgi:hypothetical protein
MSDLNELVTTERFREIHEARQQVIEDERTLNEALATKRIDDRRARRLFQRSVDTFVRELECLLDPPGEEPSEYWTDEEIGYLQRPDGEYVAIEGLGEYLALDEEIVMTVETVEEGSYSELPSKKPQERAVQPSWGLLRSAFRVGNAALTDLGMELDAGDEDRAEIDESLIKEVEKWRKANI